MLLPRLFLDSRNSANSTNSPTRSGGSFAFYYPTLQFLFLSNIDSRRSESEMKTEIIIVAFDDVNSVLCTAWHETA